MAEQIEMTWEEPPARTTNQGKYGPFFQALRDNPGRWARFPGQKGQSGAAAAIMGGKYAGAEEGEFEAVTRDLPDGEGKGTWVRAKAKPGAKAAGKRGPGRPRKDAAA